MPENEFDVAIIGSGPGGYVAAILAARTKLYLMEKPINPGDNRLH